MEPLGSNFEDTIASNIAEEDVVQGIAGGVFEDATARIWEATTGKLLNVFEHSGPVVGASFSSDGQRPPGQLGISFGVPEKQSAGQHGRRCVLLCPYFP
jgi:hypothetical protein